jgi:hypothetical protein
MTDPLRDVAAPVYGSFRSCDAKHLGASRLDYLGNDWLRRPNLERRPATLGQGGSRGRGVG